MSSQGFLPGIVEGVKNIANTAAATAISDLGVAIADATSRPATAILAGDIGGLTLTPGVYKVHTNLELTGTLFLDAQNDPDAAWIFQIGTSFTVNTAAQVVILNRGVRESTTDNVWWVCGSSVTIGSSVQMAGVVMAEQSISVGTGSRTGPVLARIGGTTLLTNAVSSYSDARRRLTSQTELLSSAQNMEFGAGSVAGFAFGVAFVGFAAAIVSTVFFFVGAKSSSVAVAQIDQTYAFENIL